MMDVLIWFAPVQFCFQESMPDTHFETIPYSQIVGISNYNTVAYASLAPGKRMNNG
jgi:hypothetical protein